MKYKYKNKVDKTEYDTVTVDEILTEKQQILNLLTDNNTYAYNVDEITSLIYPSNNYKALCSRTLKELKKEGLANNKGRYWTV